MSSTPTGDVATLTLQNAGAGALEGGYTTLGQVFAQGDLAAGLQLFARIGGQLVPVQVDVKTTWPDGSAKMAVLTLERPDLAAGASLDLVLTTAAGPAAAQPAVNLSAATTGHSFTVDIAMQGGTSYHVDVLDALHDALASGQASFWQSGSMATQARVEIPVEGSLRLVFDVTAFADGTYAVDAQFANDGAMAAVGGHIAYTATVTMDGRQVANHSIDQMQYQIWNETFQLDGVNGGQGLGDPSHGWLNIRHDAAALEQLNVVPDLDLSLQLPSTTFDWINAALQDPSWGDPLAANGVRMYMPDVGGRGDIGMVTAGSAIWLMTGDPRAAAYALGQAEASGAVPWNMWDAANDSWLNAGDYPQLWVDPRGGTGQPSNPASTGLTQQWEWTGYNGWTPETAHQPDLAFVPYLLTGERWMLDRVMAQASWNTVANWPEGERYNEATGQYNLVVERVQPRAAAWALRELENAAWAAPDGSQEQAYFRAAADANWKWLVDQIPTWTAMEGEAYGYLPNVIWGRNGRVSPWEQDYLALSAAEAAARGQEDAMTFLKWMGNFLVGRFEQAPDIFSPKDGVAISIQPAMVDANGNLIFYKTWAEVGAATVAAHLSNTDPVYSPGGWDRSQGNFAQLALASLASYYEVTGDAKAKAAYDALVALNPPYISASDLAATPQFAVTMAGLDATPAPSQPTGTTDTTPPGAPVISSATDDAGASKGAITSGGVTDDATPTFTGTAEANAKVSLYDGATLLGTTTASGTGAWSFTPGTALGNGTHSITAKAADAAGNVSTGSSAIVLTVDTIAPSAPVISGVTDNAGTTTGAVANGATTDDTTPTFTGTAEANARISVYDGATLLGTTTASSTGAWSYTPGTALGSGSHSVTFAATDTAGNVSVSSSAVTFTIGTTTTTTSTTQSQTGGFLFRKAGPQPSPADTTPPGAPAISAITDDVGTIKGAVAAGGVTDDAMPTFTGTAEANAKVSVYDGATLLGTTTASSAGAWSYTPGAALGSGGHSITFKATDAAGNVSAASSAVAFTIDTAAPGVPTISAITDDVGTIKGAVAAGGVTDDAMPTFTGTAEANAKVSVYDGATLLGTTTASSAGAWSYTPGAALGSGGHSITFKAADAAGNVSAASSPATFTVDTSGGQGQATASTPATTTVGSGSDTIVLKISQDAWKGDAQFTVSVDGVQQGGTLTAKALHASGQSDVVVVMGDWLAGGHSVSVNFLNDAYGGTASTDRNLYLDGVTWNGAAVSGSTASLYSAGIVSVTANDTTGIASSPIVVPPVTTGTTTSPTLVPTITIGSGADKLIISISEDKYQGDAQYAVMVDGMQIGGLLTASAIHGKSVDTVVVQGDWAAGQHTLSIDYVNDYQAGGLFGSRGDRNLYVEAVQFDDAAVPGGAVAVPNGSFSFMTNGHHDFVFG